MKYLVQDGEKIKKVTMEGLEEIKEGMPNEDDFINHGTDDLADIIGRFDKKVDMGYRQDLGDNHVFGYKLIGYKDISEMAIDCECEIITLNPNDKGTRVTLSNNNLTAIRGKAENGGTAVRATNGKATGKWYWETYIDKHDDINYSAIIMQKEKSVDNSPFSSKGGGIAFGYMNDTNLGEGQLFKTETRITTGLPTYTTGDILGIALDLDNRIAKFYKNNELIVEGEIPWKGEVFPAIGSGVTNGGITTINFGSVPFKYPVPNGYLPYDIDNAYWLINNLIKINDKYYTYQSREFIKVDPTEENFEQYSVNLMELLTLDEHGIKPLMTLENPEIVHLTDKPNPQLYIKGFRDLRPLMESDNPKLLISSDVEPEIRVTYHPEPQLVLPDDDIKLRMLDKIHDFTIYTNKNNGGDVKIVYSTDSGRTWEVYRDGKAEEVNIANIKEVKEKGLAPDEFNSIGEVWDDIVVDDRIRFAYYLETATLNDIAEVDKLVVEMDMHGRWRKAEHINDYDYEYDNEHIYVTFYKDGSYKVNYQG